MLDSGLSMVIEDDEVAVKGPGRTPSDLSAIPYIQLTKAENLSFTDKEIQSAIRALCIEAEMLSDEEIRQRMGELVKQAG